VGGSKWTDRELEAVKKSGTHDEFMAIVPESVRSHNSWKAKRSDLRASHELEVEFSPWDAQRKALLKKINTLEARERNQESERDFISNCIVDAAGVAQATSIPKKVKVKGQRDKEEVAMLEFSDLQMGTAREPTRTAGLGYYDKDEFIVRLDKLAQSVIEIVEIQRKGGIKCDHLVINGLGDYVEGETVYPGQGFNVDADLIEQVFVLGEAVVQRLFLPLCEVFPTVEMFAVEGNHGNAGRFGSERTNWDLVCEMWWAARMQAQKNFKMYVSASPFCLYQQFEDLHLISHGSEVKSYNRIPFYGLERAHGRYMALTGQFIHFFHVGHHHNLADIDLMFGKDIINGSFTGGTEYSIGKMQKSNHPKQMFFGLNKNHQTWKYDIFLADIPRLQPDERGIFTPVMELPDFAGGQKERSS